MRKNETHKPTSSKTARPRSLPPFAEGWEWYCRDDISLFQEVSSRADRDREIWENARDSAHLLRKRFIHSTPLEIAGRMGIRVEMAEEGKAGERILYFGESCLDPTSIRIHMDTVRKACGHMRHFAIPAVRRWFSEEAIVQAVVAHEMHHILCHCCPASQKENAAHVFARTLCGLPCSLFALERAAREVLSRRPQPTACRTVGGAVSTWNKISALTGWP